MVIKGWEAKLYANSQKRLLAERAYIGHGNPLRDGYAQPPMIHEWCRLRWLSEYAQSYPLVVKQGQI